ncbi:hypothetical protein TWF225_006542 [Orbilia oligospora]|nr:hypothetical protein TWF225_006542 [Orbilia oligospora]KAF3265056.1 hypothetical protein TWF217_002705 [Orbilia oligospora]KAF3268071.1 hypothetical protein TWF128_008085 [Orbilia oligospora]
MVGTIKQQLYISGIPQGLTMTVTALNLLPPDPPKEWRATLYDRSGRERKAPFVIGPNIDGGHIGEVKMYGAHAFPSNSLGARLEILWKLEGTATRVAARSSDSDDDGGVAYVTVPPGEEVEHPALKPADAEPEPRGADEDPPVDPNDPASWQTKLDALPPLPQPRAGEPARTGRFIVETTKWGLIQRPDYVSVLYQVGSATPLRVVSGVAATIIDMPDDALFVIGVNTKTQEIGINGVQRKDVANTLASYLIQGIFYVHEKAFGWVMGKFW